MKKESGSGRRDEDRGRQERLEKNVADFLAKVNVVLNTLSELASSIDGPVTFARLEENIDIFGEMSEPLRLRINRYRNFFYQKPENGGASLAEIAVSHLYQGKRPDTTAYQAMNEAWDQKEQDEIYFILVTLFEELDVDTQNNDGIIQFTFVGPECFNDIEAAVGIIFEGKKIQLMEVRGKINDRYYDIEKVVFSPLS